MPEHPNAIAARDGLDAFTRGDPETLEDLFAEDIVWDPDRVTRSDPSVAPRA